MNNNNTSKNSYSTIGQLLLVVVVVVGYVLFYLPTYLPTYWTFSM